MILDFGGKEVDIAPHSDNLGVYFDSHLLEIRRAMQHRKDQNPATGLSSVTMQCNVIIIKKVKEHGRPGSDGKFLLLSISGTRDMEPR